MLKERQVNGDACLCYIIGESEALQSFHLGMLTTNPQLPALPIHCQYVDGVETLILPLHEMTPAKALIETQRGPDLAQLLMMLGKSIQKLMAYQLSPENMVFDERYVYLSTDNQTVYLPYLPLKSSYNEPKTALSELLLKWMDTGMNHQRAFTHPLFIQLLLKLRQENSSFRALVDVLTTAETQSTGQNYTTLNEPSGSLDAHRPAPVFKDGAKKADKASLKPQLLMKPQWTLNAKKLISYSPIILALIISAAAAVFAPMSPSSKLGIAMVFVASGVYATQKLTIHMKKEALSPKQQNVIQAPPIEPLIKEPVLPTSFNAVPAVSEETILLNASLAKAVLMVREANGPRYFKMQKDVVTIGRNPSVCDLVLDETGIGRMHAEIHHNQGQYYIKDNQSLNGTFVNGKRITSNQYFQLSTGDLIQVAHKEVVFS